MSYIEVSIRLFPVQPYAELLVFNLSEDGYDGFMETDEGVKGYVRKDIFDEEQLIGRLKILDGKAEYGYELSDLPDTNWNEQWEKNFDPVEINESLRIRAPFHEKDDRFKFDLVISPKMSFGTGHHPTTALVADALFSQSMEGKRMLDMGSGTGILAVLAEKLGASHVTAIDIDQWCFDNAKENVLLNDCESITILKGGAECLEESSYDLILANINRNVLLEDMPTYVRSLLPEGVLIMSGFYKHDVSVISEMAESLDLTITDTRTMNDWVLLTCHKKTL